METYLNEKLLLCADLFLDAYFALYTQSDSYPEITLCDLRPENQIILQSNKGNRIVKSSLLPNDFCTENPDKREGNPDFIAYLNDLFVQVDNSGLQISSPGSKGQCSFHGSKLCVCIRENDLLEFYFENVGLPPIYKGEVAMTLSAKWNGVKNTAHTRILGLGEVNIEDIEIPLRQQFQIYLGTSPVVGNDPEEQIFI